MATKALVTISLDRLVQLRQRHVGSAFFCGSRFTRSCGLGSSSAWMIPPNSYGRTKRNTLVPRPPTPSRPRSWRTTSRTTDENEDEEE